MNVKRCENCGGKWDADAGEHLCVIMPEPEVEELEADEPEVKKVQEEM